MTSLYLDVAENFSFQTSPGSTSSAAAERVFSLLQNSFTCPLKDYRNLNMLQ